MAKIEDILKLKEAGFTAEDMAKLLPLVSEDKPEIKIEKREVKEEPKPALDMGSIEEKFDKLIERLEANAILNTKQPEDSTKTLDDVLASIIEPKE